MIMQQLTGHWHTESCNHLVKMRENINPLGDEGHNQDGNGQKLLLFLYNVAAMISNPSGYYLS